VDDIIILGYADTTVAEGIATGDQVTVDNSNFLAIETYHRHQVPGPDFPVWDHWRNDDGSPKYPQQARLIGPGFVMATSGSMQNGGIHGKMIVVSSLLDREAYPWQADWYRRQVEARLGDQTDSQFRLWFTDRALHGDVDHSRMDDRTQVVSYLGMLHQALRDVARWAEQGIAPPSSTSYAVEQGQVIVAPNAAQRLGVQPTVELGSESGQKRIEARVGEPVELVATISVPPGTGFITGIEWHTGDHEGDYLRDDTVTGSEASLKVTHSHRFSAPGTYFVTLRARSERNGNQGSPFAQLYNLDRARVVVTE